MSFSSARADPLHSKWHLLAQEHRPNNLLHDVSTSSNREGATATRTPYVTPTPHTTTIYTNTNVHHRQKSGHTCSLSPKIWIRRHMNMNTQTRTHANRHEHRHTNTRTHTPTNLTRTRTQNHRPHMMTTQKRSGRSTDGRTKPPIPFCLEFGVVWFGGLWFGQWFGWVVLFGDFRRTPWLGYSDWTDQRASVLKA